MSRPVARVARLCCAEMGAISALVESACRSKVTNLHVWLKLAAEADWKEKQVKCLSYGLRLIRSTCFHC